MISHEKNGFSVNSPEDGLFSVYIRDDVHLYRIIREEIHRGITLVEWDGCGYNGERLATQYYSFEFELSGISGRQYTYSFRSPVVSNAQHLQFVLPSDDTVYLAAADDWFLEVKSVLDGTLILDFYAENTLEPAFTARMPLHLRRVEHYTFSKLAGRTKPAAGHYTVQAYEASRPEEITSFFIHIVDGAPEKQKVEITGNIMPDPEADEKEIWEAMMQPSVVVDIDYQKHHKVYSEPDTGSVSLGTIHGQTQCLSVLEIQDEWARIGAWNHEDASYIEGWVPLRKLKVVMPNREYGLLLDKRSQTLSVYYYGKKIETLMVSTGKMEKYQYDQETSAGCFVTGLHRVDFSTQGNRYDFVIQYDGGNLLHQIPYSSDGRKDFTYGRAYLGAKASHACIRIQDYPGPESGINAYWIWTHIPYHTKVIILDDQEEREKEKAVLSGKIPAGAVWRNSLPDYSSPVHDGETVTMTFGGSVFPGSAEDAFDSPKSINAFIIKHGVQYPFSLLNNLFSSDDLTCIHLGCVLKEDRTLENNAKSRKIRGLPAYARMFSSGSVELVSFAGDHIYDYREAGIESTVKAVEKTSDIVRSGFSKMTSVKGHLFGFSVFSEEDYLSDPGIIARIIQELRESGCEYVICQCCWGKENEEQHNKLQIAIARACQRAGADLVIGWHPNMLQGIDFIGKMPVIYSPGTLLNSGSVRIKTYDSVLVQVTFHTDQKGSMPQIRLIPVLSSSSAGKRINDYLPVPAEGADKKRILDTIQKDTAYDITMFLD